MKLNACATDLIKKVGREIPRVDLDVEETHKLISLLIFASFILAVTLVSTWRE